VSRSAMVSPLLASVGNMSKNAQTSAPLERIKRRRFCTRKRMPRPVKSVDRYSNWWLPHNRCSARSPCIMV
jgi:hypothetical protein